MSDWLAATDCRILDRLASADAALLRRAQRLLEAAAAGQGINDTRERLLGTLAEDLQATVTLWEAKPAWTVVDQTPARPADARLVSRELLSEVLDREAGTIRKAVMAACVSYTDRPNRVLTAQRPSRAFDAADLEYLVAAGHYLGVALERARAWDDAQGKAHRLRTVLAISRQLNLEADTVALLEQIAEHAAKLLGCERATIFVWDKGRGELVGRPALGLPGGELRIPEGTGIVGEVVREGAVRLVNDVRDEKAWSATVDRQSGFATRNLLCVPLSDGAGQRIGALQVLNKPDRFSDDDVATLEALAEQAAAALANVREREALLRSHHELDEAARLASRIVGEAPAIQALRAAVARVARTDLPVLILGESGTGKDVVARALHYSSPRQRAPYIPVNCAAIAESLLESELFGHEKGAFTGADATRAGKFEAASGGTLFLDEIGELSGGGQAKLLRVLEEKVVYRVGGSQPIPVDTRIVAATNRNLADLVRTGKFREDLYYRLTVVTVDLPPLRDRAGDTLVLAEHFLQQFAKQAGRKALKFSADAKRRLQQHDWPGNVRELRNLLERLAYLCPGDKVEEKDLAFILRPAKAGDARFADTTLAAATDEFQRQHIQQAIDRSGGHMSDAAQRLGLHRQNLYRKLRQLGIDPGRSADA